ncbi:autotransporter domain-containing protein [Pseudooceanicola sp. HF7]|uniref:autotransporter domain-containing protein n=1 Tax=Pseudooceanicola sp. HF7 TaxID=2721560 RepID=UPI00143036D5|nr:autotransporter domain-containing protein [Pseudooceanicola sp. HF7]NIZ11760.1 autotransporter outer membrane beta-barrel domain-containing protein [Pseudooceanicola sp. HF7]
MLKLIATCALGAVTLCSATAATAEAPQARGAGGPPPLSIQVLANMGKSGLLGIMASNERYGTVQSRVGVGRAMAALADLPGTPTFGYSDDLSDLIMPIGITKRLNAGPSETASYLRFTTDNRWTDAARTRNGGAELETDSEQHGFGVQYLHAPNPDLLMGVGVEVSQNQVDMRHNGGRIENDTFALRADLLKVVSDHWGLAMRAAWFDETSDTSIPLPMTTMESEQDLQRLYLQFDAVGTYSQADIAALPANVILRPNIGAAWQKVWFDETTNSLGGTVKGPGGNSTETYGSAYAKAALQHVGPGKIHPYAGLGVDVEFANSYEDLVNEPAYLNSFVGATVSLSRSAMLNVVYGRYDGFKGNRTKETLVMALDLTF